MEASYSQDALIVIGSISSSKMLSVLQFSSCGTALKLNKSFFRGFWQCLSIIKYVNVSVSLKNESISTFIRTGNGVRALSCMLRYINLLDYTDASSKCQHTELGYQLYVANFAFLEHPGYRSFKIKNWVCPEPNVIRQRTSGSFLTWSHRDK